MRLQCFGWALGLFLCAWNVEAKVFRNAYVSFELPDSWNCVLEHTEWVCRSSQVKESKEAIIILTAKEIGPGDSYPQYIDHLKVPQPVAYKAANGQNSRVIYPPKTVKINDQPWIDGLHLASEVPNYYTRYLATIKDKIAVLVTLSAHKDFYTKYSQDFFRAVNSLRVIATKNLLNPVENGPLRQGELIGPNGLPMPSDLLPDAAADGSGGRFGGMSKTKSLLMGLAALLAIVGVWIFLKSKRR